MKVVMVELSALSSLDFTEMKLFPEGGAEPGMLEMHGCRARVSNSQSAVEKIELWLPGASQSG